MAPPELPADSQSKSAPVSDPLKVKRPLTWHIALTALFVVLGLGLSFGLANTLLPSDVDIQVPYSGANGETAQVTLYGEFFSVDPIQGSLVMDWHIDHEHSCQTFNSAVADIYVDHNLLAETQGSGDSDEPPSTNPPSDPVFRLNTTAFCIEDDYSIATFRTVWKLVGDSVRTRSPSLQDYPFDHYHTKVSMFAINNGTGERVRLQVGDTAGIPVNFVIHAYDGDPNHRNRATPRGVEMFLRIERSRAVRVLAITIVVSNWIVTLVFLLLTAAIIVWREDVVRDMFVVPVATLFAFTTVRAFLPGAPSTFGAYIDIIGILPNIVLMTLCSGVLLSKVLVERIRSVSGKLRSPEAGEAVKPTQTSVSDSKPV